MVDSAKPPLGKVEELSISFGKLVIKIPLNENISDDEWNLTFLLIRREWKKARENLERNKGKA